ncbi:MAG: hypothetical protein AABW90_03175 [Nanoarchaeota archaeon]
MNKKGYYRFADIGMFFLSFAIVTVGIAIGIYLFYSNTVDIRDHEAKIISDRLVIAITKNGKLNEDILKNDFNILKEARLNDKIINNGDFYFKIEIFDNSNIIKKIEQGNRGFVVECGLKGKKFPKCVEKDFLIDNYRVKILAASNQQGEV